MLACVCSSTLGTDTTDILGAVEYWEAMTLHDVHEFNELHLETCIRFVAAIVFHCIVPCHTWELTLELNATDCLEQMLCHTLEERNHILLLNKTHLAVNLCKLGLAVGTQVLVAETFHNLEITVETRHHQQLLEELWTLRQSIELARVHA